jgi:DNA-binding response OmpR family regulator
MRQQRLRILICDTEAKTLIDLEPMLEDAGFDTTTTWEAADFARLLDENLFHLLIMGDHPPQADAEVMLRELRGSHPQAPGVLCLALQRSLDESDTERLRSAGATAVVSRQDYASIVKQVEFCLRPANPSLRNSG